jgi:hypothetical protein
MRPCRSRTSLRPTRVALGRIGRMRAGDGSIVIGEPADRPRGGPARRAQRSRPWWRDPPHAGPATGRPKSTGPSQRFGVQGRPCELANMSRISDRALIDPLTDQLSSAQTFDGAREIGYGSSRRQLTSCLLRADAPGPSRIQPQHRGSVDAGARSYARVTRWASSAGATLIEPADVALVADRFGTTHQLPLVMAG